MTERKTDPVSGIEYCIPSPEDMKRLREEGRELRRKLEEKLAPMSRLDAEQLRVRVR